MSTCRSCGAPIEWGVTSKGRRLPLDPARIPPDPKANVAVLAKWKDGTLAVEVVAPADAIAKPTRLSHFATCPHAKQHRRSS